MRYPTMRGSGFGVSPRHGLADRPNTLPTPPNPCYSVALWRIVGAAETKGASRMKRIVTVSRQARATERHRSAGSPVRSAAENLDTFVVPVPSEQDPEIASRGATGPQHRKEEERRVWSPRVLEDPP